MKVAPVCESLAAAALLACVAAARAADKPNLVIFYADDLGWGECGCQGNKDIPTPHIDSIAANGVRFTQGYVAATYCSPSRAGLMSTNDRPIVGRPVSRPCPGRG